MNWRYFLGINGRKVSLFWMEIYKRSNMEMSGSVNSIYLSGIWPEEYRDSIGQSVKENIEEWEEKETTLKTGDSRKS